MRVTLCIGCDGYEFLPPLAAAETDAVETYRVLTDSQYGAYDPALSRLLLSPDLGLVREALGEILYSGNKISDFTFFFAGHAGIAHGGLYLTFRDTKFESIALSGLNFGELAKIIVAATPMQVNFVLDACQSAGLGFDLSAILKESLTGTAETTGVAALAAAASNESALEVGGSGVFTAALLDALVGRNPIHKDKPYLSIPDIGESVRVRCAEASQTVSFWMLNYQGPNRFSHNPNFTGESSTSSFYSFEALAHRLDLPKKHILAIKRAAFDIHDGIDEHKLALLLQDITSGRPIDDSVLLISGLLESMTAEAQGLADPFAEARVLGVFQGQLLPFVGHSPLAAQYHLSAMNRVGESIVNALNAIRDEIKDNPYALLSSEALSDLYYLPIRISDVLGRVGWLIASDYSDFYDLNSVEKLIRDLLEIYGNSIVALSDEQAGPILVFVAGCLLHDWIDIAEEVIGRLFCDVVDASAKVAHYGLDGELALRYLQHRYEEVFGFDSDLYARPSDLVSVVVILSALLGLDEAVDRSMILLDHTPLNVLAPNTALELGRNGPISGKNVGLHIGHGVWRCVDVRREWHATVLPLISGGAMSDSTLRSAASLGAISMRDRVPWFVLDRITWPDDPAMSRVSST